MIDDAVAYLRREVVNHLGVADTDVIAGNVHTLEEDGARDVSLAGPEITTIQMETQLR
jgi:hypothetical protein